MEFKDAYLLYAYHGNGVVEYDTEQITSALPYRSKHFYFGNDDQHHLVHVYTEDDGMITYKSSIAKDKFLDTIKEQAAKIQMYLKENCKKPKDLPRFFDMPYFGLIHSTELPHLLRVMKQYIRENRS